MRAKFGIFGTTVSPRSAPGPVFIEPGSPWIKEYIDNFNLRLRADLLDRGIF